VRLAKSVHSSWGVTNYFRSWLKAMARTLADRTALALPEGRFLVVCLMPNMMTYAMAMAAISKTDFIASDADLAAVREKETT
jgi:hypothetical protein